MNFYSFIRACVRCARVGVFVYRFVRRIAVRARYGRFDPWVREVERGVVCERGFSLRCCEPFVFHCFSVRYDGHASSYDAFPCAWAFSERLPLFLAVASKWIFWDPSGCVRNDGDVVDCFDGRPFAPVGNFDWDGCAWDGWACQNDPFVADCVVFWVRFDFPEFRGAACCFFDPDAFSWPYCDPRARVFDALRVWVFWAFACRCRVAFSADATSGASQERIAESCHNRVSCWDACRGLAAGPFFAFRAPECAAVCAHLGLHGVCDQGGLVRGACAGH